MRKRGLYWDEAQAAAHAKRLAHVPGQPLQVPPRIEPAHAGTHDTKKKGEHMDIFKDARSKLIFAFTLAAHPGDTHANGIMMVRQALHDAGATDHAVEIQDPTTFLQMREYAQQILVVVHTQLLPEKAAVILARYSKSWPERRTACDLLRAHFQRKVERILDNVPAVTKLIQRQFIQERDRTGTWGLDDIAANYHATPHAVRQAAVVVHIHADQLERAALEAFEIQLAEMVAKESTHG